MENNSGRGNCGNCCILVGVLRILCYKCCKCSSRNYERTAPVEFDLLCVGLQGSGKSTLLAALTGESTDNIQPTSGFAIKACHTKNCILHIKELGGSDRVRQYWDRYYDRQQGVIVVIDASEEDPQTLRHSCEALKKHLEDPRIEGIPLLLLCNTKSSLSKVIDDCYVMSLVHDGQPFLLKSCSSKDQQNLKRIFDEYSQLLIASNCT